MTRKQAVQGLSHCVERLAATVAGLSDQQFLAPLGGWSPRDIVAHLVGWNRCVIEGSRQIRRGELPFYDVDPGEDYSKVNAALVREYPSRDRGELLAELRVSAAELRGFLGTVAAADWSRDFGVRHGGSRLTIAGTVGELIDDYEHHRGQIERWAAGGDR